MKETLEPFLHLLMTQTDQYEHLQALLNNKPNTRYHESNLLLYLKLLPKFIPYIERLELNKYHYSPEIEALAACLLQNPITDHYHFETVCNYPTATKHTTIELEQMRHFLSHFLKDLRERLLSPSCKLVINQQQSKANRSYRSMCQYVDALFAKQARQVVIRVDVGYGEDTNITLEQFESDLEKLFEHTRTKPIFAYLNGFICKIEYGVSKKHHPYMSA